MNIELDSDLPCSYETVALRFLFPDDFTFRTMALRSLNDPYAFKPVDVGLTPIIEPVVRLKAEGQVCPYEAFP